ncbi:hypothetical protein TH47_16045 [Thalassospira sp. MCCC 1A02803]|nr:hypothetical protein TH47_16045 [Thalassospira sp. MCCC 1A02803]
MSRDLQAGIPPEVITEKQVEHDRRKFIFLPKSLALNAFRAN